MYRSELQQLAGQAFAKGHATGNDFVLLADPTGALQITAEQVAALCHRHFGIGGDGLIRAVPTSQVSGYEQQFIEHPKAYWFMDYRNNDGSIAEMCGNGVRVFAHYCRTEGLVDTDAFTVGSRAGARPVTVHSADDADADVSVSMGPVALRGPSEVRIAGTTLTGEAVDVGNPHLACVVDGLTPERLATLDLTTGAELDSALFPDGANVEILTPLTPGGPTPADEADFHAHMRVFERGVGETRSCGTGLVAAAAAALSGAGRDSGSVAVTVPGGDVLVTVGDGSAVLRGPSRLVARGRLVAGWAD